MTRKCPDCQHYFSTTTTDEYRMKESFRVNPGLKWICPNCGLRIEYFYWLKAQQRKAARK